MSQYVLEGLYLSGWERLPNHFRVYGNLQAAIEALNFQRRLRRRPIRVVVLEKAVMVTDPEDWDG
jgi:hypothetical protein